MKISDLLKSNNDDGSFLFNDRQRAIKNHRLMQWAKVATFGLYIVAVFMLYVSDVWGIASFVEKNSNEYIALAIFSTISFVLAYFLASSKEAVYEDIAIHRSEGWKLKPTQYAAMALFLSSGLLFEMFSTTNNQQHIANTAAESSTMMKSIQGTDVSVAGSVALTESLQKAQVRLATCRKRLAEGKVKDCVESQANVKAVQDSMTISNQLAQTASQQAMTNKVDGMLKIREHFDKPMFQAIGKATNTDNNTGMLMVIGVLIFIFECQHIMALFAYANALYRLKQSEGRRENETQSPAPMPEGVMSKLANGADSAKQTVSEYATKVEQGLKASPGIIAAEYARAQNAREQFYQKAADKLDELTPENLTRERFFKLMYMEIRSRVLNGDVRPTVTPVTDAVTDVIRQHTRTLGLQPSLIGKPERQKIAEKILDKLEREGILEMNDIQGVGHPKYVLAKRWRNEPAAPIPVPENNDWKPTWEKTTIREVMEPQVKPDMPQLVETSGFKQSPEQRAIVDHLHQEQMQTYREELRGGSHQFRDVPLDTPAPPSRATVSETVLPTVPARSETVSDTVPARSQNGIAETVQNGLTGEAKQAETDLYPDWIAQVRGREISPGARDCKRFISQSTKSKDDKTGLTVQEMGRIWVIWQNRALADGVLKPNPEYSNGKAKYILT